jgi:hypothetical protein
MFKKTLAIALLACSIPAMANASWFLTTQAKSAGGTLSSSNALGQVVTDGAITKQYDTITSQTVSYAGTNAGVQYVTESDASASGTVKTVLYDKDSALLGHATVTTPYPSTFTFTPVDGHTYTFGASFAATSLPVSASITGGTVTPAKVGNITYGYTLSQGTGPLVFTFSPAPGYSIAAIANVPAGATVANVPGAVNQRATVTFPIGYQFTSAFALSATTANTTPSLSAGMPQTKVVGKTVTLTAAAANVDSPTYAWSYLSGPVNTVAVTTDVNGKVITTVTPGPALTLTGTNPVTFTAPSAVGQYKFLVTVGTLKALATVNVVATAADATNQCQFCHTTNKIADQTIGVRYSASIHGQSTSSSCAGCHYGTGFGGHPGTVAINSVDPATFLAKTDGVVGGKGNIANNGGLFCATCHTPPHAITGLGTGVTCAGCHTGTSGTNGTFDAHSIQPTSTLATLTYDLCENCHSQATKGNATASIYTTYKASIHGQSDGASGHSTCAACHSGSHDPAKHASSSNVNTTTFLVMTSGVQTSKGPLAKGALFCAGCHTGGYMPHSLTGLGTGVTCAGCHTGTNGTNGTGDAHAIQAPSNLTSLPNALCMNCHSQATKGNATGSIVTGYNASIHKAGEAFGSSCAYCHTGSHDTAVHASKLNVSATTFKVISGSVTVNAEGTTRVIAKGNVYCTACHQGDYAIPHPTNLNAGVTCNGCHTDATGSSTGTGDAHNIVALPKCVQCHAFAQAQVAATLVNDNNGVRAITGANGEFAKKSHHIYNGVGNAPTDAQCVACHLEGKAVTSYGVTSIAVDGAYHMKDAKIHLRNAHDDSDYAWDPQLATSADHTAMDNFCMSCHSATGADSPMSASIQAFLNANKAFVGAPTATATNPFGDLVSNSYDKQSRVKVVDVDSQFNTDNYSHHAVKGKRYTTRTSTVAVAAWVAYSTAGGHSTDVTVPGSPRFNASTQKTLYDGGLLGWNGTAGTKYTPLDTATNKAGARIGDDSQLHCGDCHTVGQWKAGSSTNADGSATGAAIGAHGSNNEYMLRNTKGTDALNGLGTFICYNCHNDKAGGNTSGGYYSGAYWNNATGKWVAGSGKLHLSIHGGASSTQYGGGSGCIQASAGLAFTSYTGSIHDNKSWAGSWSTPATSVSLLLGSNGQAWDEGLGITNNQKVNGTGAALPYLSIKLQSVLNGGQTVFFDTNGDFAGIYSSFNAYAAGSSDLANATAVNSYAAGNGNPSNKSTWDGTKNTVLDADGTVIDASVFAGTGRNHFVGGNIFGNGCMNCHNVGRTGFGGIHGGKNTYSTGFSTSNHGIEGQAAPVDTQSTYRFMPGLGNYGYIPAGAGKEPGKYTTDATGKATLVEEPSIAIPGKAGWEAWNGVGTSAAGGCYTNDYASQNAGWSGCNHHGNGGVNDGGPGGTQPLGFGAGGPPTKADTAGQVGRTLNY